MRVVLYVVALAARVVPRLAAQMAFSFRLILRGIEVTVLTGLISFAILATAPCERLDCSLYQLIRIRRRLCVSARLHFLAKNFFIPAADVGADDPNPPRSFPLFPADQPQRASHIRCGSLILPAGRVRACSMLRQYFLTIP